MHTTASVCVFHDLFVSRSHNQVDASATSSTARSSAVPSLSTNFSQGSTSTSVAPRQRPKPAGILAGSAASPTLQSRVKTPAAPLTPPIAQRQSTKLASPAATASTFEATFSVTQSNDSESVDVPRAPNSHEATPISMAWPSVASEQVFASGELTTTAATTESTARDLMPLEAARLENSQVMPQKDPIATTDAASLMGKLTTRQLGRHLRMQSDTATVALRSGGTVSQSLLDLRRISPTFETQHANQACRASVSASLPRRPSIQLMSGAQSLDCLTENTKDGRRWSKRFQVCALCFATRSIP